MREGNRIVRIEERDQAAGIDGSVMDNEVADVAKKSTSRALSEIEQQSVRDRDKVSDFEMYARAYEHLLKIRDLDNTLMWTRANIALILQAGLLAFVAPSITNLTANNRFISIVIAGFGLMISAFWVMLTRGGLFWIKYWQRKMAEIEPKLFGGSIEIFSSHPHNRPDRVSEHKKAGYSSTNGAIKLITWTTTGLWSLIILYIAYYAFWIGVPPVPPVP